MNLLIRARRAARRRQLLLAALFLGPALISFGGDEFFDSAGVKIHYIEKGTGDPVILIHGFTSSARINWGMAGVIDLLAKNHRVIAMDCRGHGQSDKPLKVEDYGTKMVDDVIRLMDHLKIQKAHVIGYSMGGMITMKLLATHPERVQSAMLGGMGWFNTRLGQPLRAEVEKNENERNSREACFKGFLQLQISEEDVKGIKVPLAVVVGSRDPTKRRYVEPLRKLRPEIPVTIVPGATHLTCIAKREFKDALVNFLDKQTKESAGGK